MFIPIFFEYVINRAKCEKEGVKINRRIDRITKSEAEKKGIYILRHGYIKKLDGHYNNTPEVIHHREASKNLNILQIHIENLIKETDKNSFNTNWLKLKVDEYYHPEKYIIIDETIKNIYDIVEDYLAENKTFSEYHTKHIRTAFRHVSRYERFIQMTTNKEFIFGIDSVTRETIADFRDYLRNEYDLQKEYPKIFKKILADTALSLKRKQKIEKRGENAIVKILKLVKAFFNWAYNAKHTTNKPFDGYTIGSEQFGTPFYISIEERNKIAAAPMPTKHLETQRDIFIFQCLIGCKVTCFYLI